MYALLFDLGFVHHFVLKDVSLVFFQSQFVDPKGMFLIQILRYKGTLTHLYEIRSK